MRKAYVEIEVSDTFEKGNCDDCPLGILNNEDWGYACALTMCYEIECPANIRIQEGSGAVE